MESNLIEALKIFVFSSVLFVWIVRYNNIVEEFRSYNYPNWLRDLVGITKVSLVIMIMSANIFLVKIGAMGIMILMLAAVITHLRVRNPLFKMLPSMSLFTFCSLIWLGSLA